VTSAIAFGVLAHSMTVVTVVGFSNNQAANHYVTSTGAGVRDGSSWSNACDGFTGACNPALLVRGDTYIVADGDYIADGVLLFSTRASGTTRITIQKATVADHGSSIGWADDMGDDQASFDAVAFDSPYWTLEGQVGSGTSGYGFKVDPQQCTGAALVKGVDLGQNNSGMYVAHTEIAHCGEDLLRDGTRSPGNCSPAGSCGLNTDGIYSCNWMPTTDLQIRHVYIHDLTRDGITMCSVDNVLIEHVRIERNHGADVDSHGQGIAFIAPPMRNATVRHSVFVDVVGTAAIAWLGANGMTYSDMKVYGNQFYSTDPVRYWYSPNAIYAREGTNQVGFLIYNNTFYNVVRPKTGLWGTFVSNSESRNNLYVNSQFSSNPPAAGVTYSHNFYYNNTGLYVPVGETEQQNGGANPFINPAVADFRLSRPTLPGLTLGSPFDVDLLGVRRGADGVWDRGAFEEAGLGPNPPVNLRIIR
jgi:hypothetical protein